ncbi:MAG: ABC transporter permease [Chloroflexi bacterium]|nr:ABC transporter permease [Chloroflexota bacterium]MCI0578269.1 ABC transporter permease [Chloroflexota bacterium]MCI0648782.1 ABC transporter permease [Chloroflexota bacterium]MCI0727250.1 ABC transporter permease [Chloroflexota bacterium]
MTAYIIRRLLVMPIILFGVTLLIFAVLQTLDSTQRASLYVRDIPRNENQVAAIIRRYGLDDPLPVQYWHWLVGRRDPVTGEIVGGVLRGDLGYSQTGREPVVEVLKRRLPASVELAIWSAAPIIAIGIWLGIQAALHHNKPIDQAARVFAILGYSFPTFVFGLLMLLIFYAKLGWFAPGRLDTQFNLLVNRPAEFTQYTRMMTFDALLNLRFDIFLNALRHMVLPIITLSYLSWALLLKVTRSSMLEALRQDYVTTARAKGLAERVVINRHVLKNALIPVATIAGATVAGLLNGVVITETIFDLPGLGSAAANAARSLDLFTMSGYALFTAALFVSVNLVVDVLYGVLDPRVRLE